MSTKLPAVPEALVSFIREGEAFIIVGHKEPDGDCVGSQLALTSALRRLGKTAVACTVGPFKRSEVKPFERRFVPWPADSSGYRLIVLDCSALERVGDLPAAALPTALIDHHESGAPAGDAVYLAPHAPSTTLLALRVIEALGLSPTREEAELLLFGLCTDTGFFRHIDAGGAETFRAAARLIDAGASPKAAFAAINGGKTLASRNLTGLVLSRARAFFGGRLLYSFEKLEDADTFGAESRDSDMLYQLLMSVEGAEAAAIIRQEKPGSCTLGLRSKDRVDVGRVAAAFGGGGHKNAAGAALDGTIAALEPILLDAFAPFFPA